MKHKLKGKVSTRAVWLDGEELKPEASQKIYNHSPDGFNWGYRGSGAAQLALAIILKLTGKAEGYQDFKGNVIAAIPFGADFEIEFELMSAETKNALETYRRTIRDENRGVWPTWILAVSNSLAAGEWIGFEGCPSYAKEVFELAKADQKVSFSDSI